MKNEKCKIKMKNNSSGSEPAWTTHASVLSWLYTVSIECNYTETELLPRENIFNQTRCKLTCEYNSSLLIFWWEVARNNQTTPKFLRFYSFVKISRREKLYLASLLPNPSPYGGLEKKRPLQDPFPLMQTLSPSVITAHKYAVCGAAMTHS